MAIEECLEGSDRRARERMSVLLCVAEPSRPGRIAGLEELLEDIQRSLGVTFASDSAVLAGGRVGVCQALARARELLSLREAQQILVVATDSLLPRATLEAYETEGRLLTPRNSNGFIPGEAAGAVLVGTAPDAIALRCRGIGFGRETASIGSGEPLRADGLAAAIKTALSNADCEIHDVDYRLSDLSGEHFYFKEAALALSRTLRCRKEEFDLWHPAECIGETGAAAGVAMLAVADAARRKGYAPGPRVLLHLANDDGQRAAAVVDGGTRS